MPIGKTLASAIGWGSAMSLSVQLGLWLGNRAETFTYWHIAALAFLGGALAWPLACAMIRFSAHLRGRETAFASAILYLSGMTAMVTAVLFAPVFWLFFAAYHGDFLSAFWFKQMAFTFAAAVYQFIVMGLRLYLPLAPLAILAVAFVIARAHRPPPPPGMRPLPRQIG